MISQDRGCWGGVLKFFVGLFVAFVFVSAQVFAESVSDSIPFSLVLDRLVVVHAVVNGSVPVNLLLDTGAGLDVISQSLCAKLACKPSGEFTGKRMNGEGLTVKLATIGAVALGKLKQRKWNVGVTDIFEKLPPQFGRIDGAVSLKFFQNQPFSIDFRKLKLLLLDEEGLTAAAQTGKAAKVKIDSEDGVTLGFLLPLKVGSKVRNFEVDTGSAEVVFPVTSMTDFGINENSPGVRVREGKNETGHPFKSFHTELKQSFVIPPGGPSLHLGSLPVVFEEIKYDGVIGSQFLKRVQAIFDVPNSRMIFE